MEAKPVMDPIHLFSHIFAYVQHHDVCFDLVPHTDHEESIKIGIIQLKQEETIMIWIYGFAGLQPDAPKIPQETTQTRTKKR